MNETDAILSFDCKKCGNRIVERDPELPGFDYGAERHSDGQGLAELEVVCDECGAEYSVQISNMFDQFEAEVLDAPDIDVRIKVPPERDEEYDYQEYLWSYVPSEPRDRYEHSLRLLDEMVAAAGPLKTYSMFYRMLLLQHVAMMEAYLCDRLITLVGLPDVRLKLIQGYPRLRDEKYQMVALASNPDFVAMRTGQFLKSQLYHELDEVEKMFQSALGSSPFLDTSSKTFLKGVMINRHHCVHRDGKDNDGKVLQDVDAFYISEVRTKISALVQNIEAKFAAEILKVRSKPEF